MRSLQHHCKVGWQPHCRINGSLLQGREIHAQRPLPKMKATDQDTDVDLQKQRGSSCCTLRTPQPPGLLEPKSKTIRTSTHQPNLGREVDTAGFWARALKVGIRGLGHLRTSLAQGLEINKAQLVGGAVACSSKHGLSQGKNQT